jgi:hypothetical protein
MGTSASRLKSGTSLQGKDLFQLKKSELRVLIDLHPWTKDEILLVTRSLKEKLANDDDSLPGFYSIEDDSPEIDLAVRINALSKEVALLRFHMVPSRLKEPLFWKSVIVMLKERFVEYNARHPLQVDDLDEAADLGGNDPKMPEHLSKNTEQKASRTESSTTSTRSYEDDAAMEETAEEQPLDLVGGKGQEMEITVLQHRIHELEHILKANGLKVPQHHQYRHIHKGEWLMTKDSADFLMYPLELKENMRREKQKRLNQVHKDMKFILDTDDIADTNGHWACCGETMYYSDCGKTKRYAFQTGK